MLHMMGICAIAVAVGAIVGAIVQNRVLLLLYSVVMVMVMSAFSVPAGSAFMLKTEMKDWEPANFPAEDQEIKLAKTINEVYCYAETATTPRRRRPTRPSSLTPRPRL
ncbi:hypothetical protein PR003_g15829 [Phytophthora rubi]|uniref:Uncharacterized protein n=1 Tax=Phytophthora rubi TaxID=129364 RepID=A0A6A3LGJ1_9STRA|nr:hypothetical protein PR002_g15120 [Phytophthora rubi]KAE9017158.1 hypothetical protein PR001_g14472 [Phytophthora rubi]KAE9328235.1 hypothetical protein PR003_g15829 [Phytophthora rubi]